MDLVKAFDPVVIVSVEGVAAKPEMVKDVVERCLAVLEAEYKILLDSEHNNIYITKA